MCSRNKMIWTHTGRVLAFLQYFYIYAEFANMQIVGSPLRVYHFALIVKRAVSTIDRCCRPDPAGFRLFNLCPKPGRDISYFLGVCFHHAAPRTVLLLAK